MALQLRRAKTDWSGCCQMAVQGALWLANRLSLNLNFSFLNRILLLLNQVASQLSSRGWVDPVPDPILPEKFLGTAGNRIRNLFNDRRFNECNILSSFLIHRINIYNPYLKVKMYKTFLRLKTWKQNIRYAGAQTLKVQVCRKKNELPKYFQNLHALVNILNFALYIY